MGFGRSTSPKDLPPSDLKRGSKREQRHITQHHFLHLESEYPQHKEYVKDMTRDDFKMYPQWDDKLTEHNGQSKGKFVYRPKAIVEEAGGAC